MAAEHNSDSDAVAQTETSGGSHFVSEGAGGPLPPVLEPGTDLGGRFTIQRLIGIGRVGAVHQARDAIRGDSVALKLVDTGPASAPAQAEDLRREASLRQAVSDYQNVIRVHDLYDLSLGGGSLLGMSMEYADGGTLRDWLLANRENLDWRRAEGLTLFTQVCEGIGAVHDEEIIHGDVKPENLVLMGGAVKVTDFGAAVRRGASNRPIAMGTPAYASPEQFNAAYADDLDPRCDIYALGVLLYEIMHSNCRPPFAGSRQRLRELHLHAEAPPLSGVEPQVARVVACCLQKDHERRYRDVWELLDDLAGSGVDDPRQSAPWERIRQSMAGRDFAEAAQWCKAVLRSVPDHSGAQQLLNMLERRYERARQLYAAASQDLELRGVADALAVVRAAIQVYPGHPDGGVVLLRLAARVREYRGHLREGRRALLEGAWQTGVSCLRQAQRIHPNAPRLGQSIESLSMALHRIEELRGHMNRAIADRERGRALTLARCVDRCAADLQRAGERAANDGGRDEPGRGSLPQTAGTSLPVSEGNRQPGGGEEG